MKSYFKLSSNLPAKSIKQAYRFWFLLGAHNAYFGNWVRQFLLWFLLGSWLPLVLLPQVEFFHRYLGVFAIAFPAIGLFWLAVDYIFIPYYVKKSNELNKSLQQNIDRNGNLMDEGGTLGYPIST